MATEGGDTQSQTETILSRITAFMADLRGFKKEMAQQEEVVRLTSKWSGKDQPTARGCLVKCSTNGFHGGGAHQGNNMAAARNGGTKFFGGREGAYRGRGPHDAKDPAHQDSGQIRPWMGTIVEYETNKLGLDSDDTKQLTRAEKEAQ